MKNVEVEASEFLVGEQNGVKSGVTGVKFSYPIFVSE